MIPPTPTPTPQFALPRVSVALPVHRAGGTLERAFGDIARQRGVDLDILIVLNGSDEETRRVARACAERDGRVRVLELERANLAGALNLAIAEASHELIARMDADDECPADRLALQAAEMEARPNLGALGCAWEAVTPGGEARVVRPPTSPGEARWRLLVDNPFAHGSVMLRRSAVRAAGAYNPRFERAQDYDLWLRLARVADIAALPQVLYRHHLRHAGAGLDGARMQARAAAEAMLHAWSHLPTDERASERVGEIVARSLMNDGRPGELGGELERAMGEGVLSREAFMAWLWMRGREAEAPQRAVEVCRRSRVREVVGAMIGAGVREAYVWGAGRHTAWLLSLPEIRPLRVRGIIDDHRTGTHAGCAVHSPDVLNPGDGVLISSDWHEPQVWARSASARARGVRVYALYGADAMGEEASEEGSAGGHLLSRAA